MKIERSHITKFKGGWFIGDFEPSLLKTKDFEVSIKIHLKDEVWDKHTHKVATEYNYVVSGLVEIDGAQYGTGDIFIVPPNFIMNPTFLDDCTIVCIKTPSVKGDKYICD